MFSRADVRRGRHLHVPYHKQRNGVGNAERLKSIHLFCSSHIDVRRSKLYIGFERYLRLFGRKTFPCIFVDAAFEFREIFPRDGEPGSKFMTAVLDEQIGTERESFDEVETFDASSRALADVAVGAVVVFSFKRYENRRAFILFGYP